jgi:hypothetical protein
VTDAQRYLALATRQRDENAVSAPSSKRERPLWGRQIPEQFRVGVEVRLQRRSVLPENLALRVAALNAVEVLGQAAQARSRR